MAQFEKGNRLGGRKPGSKNRRSKALINNIEKFLSARFGDLESDWDNLSTKDRWRLFTDLASFMIPKKQSTSNQISFDQLPEETLDEMIEQLKQSVNNE